MKSYDELSVENQVINKQMPKVSKNNHFFRYKKINEVKNININKLRPKGSYKYLIEGRNHNTAHLLEDGIIPKQKLQKVNCRSCGCSDQNLVFKKDGFDIVECIKCKLIYVGHILNDEFYEDTYSSEEYAKLVVQLGYDSHPYRKERFGSERIDAISSYVASSNPSFLDVGCSTGFVVQEAFERGWSARGIDLNSHAIKFGVDKYNLNLSDQNFFNIKDNFDCIGMYDVLEHVVDPAKFLKYAYQVLNKKGIIHIYVPNWNSASRYVLGKEAHFIWPSHHLTYFTPFTLSNMLKINNFEVVEMETEGLDFYDIDWMKQEGILKEKFDMSPRILEIIQFLANAGGHGKNLRCIARKIE